MLLLARLLKIKRKKEAMAYRTVLAAVYVVVSYRRL
jgi:hypothetical protein